ncbi:hypothetical protein BJY52DRAFT_1225079 [Lactarius psammicola]|nr:hypothetical protein BJY52DRAFT_1225079 [Lactarius psammicola]
MPVVRFATCIRNVVISGGVIHFDFHGMGSDIILRSGIINFRYFRLPYLYLVNSSPVLRDLIQGVLSTSDVANRKKKEPLPVVKLPESAGIVFSLLTFIFPVAPVLPSNTAFIMKLLAVAQKYQMDSVLTDIRAHSRQHPSLFPPETALHDYFLAQMYGLHQEVLRAARSTLRLSVTTLEDLVGKIDFVPGAYLHELLEYHKRVRKGLALSLLEFRKFNIPDVVKDLRCGTLTLNSIPQWLDDYIGSLAQAPHLFDIIEFENTRARHIRDETSRSTTCPCASIPSQAVRTFWEALTTVVHGTMDKADSTLALVKEEPTSENSDPPSVPLCLKIPDANIIIRSSDRADFRVHKSVLALSSPFFEDSFSLPQPPDGEIVDGLPVVQLSEDAELLNSLVSLLYPIPPVIPGSYEKVFALLAACQKYDMTSIQSYIRDEIKRGRFPMPVGAEAFRAYAIASSMELIPEMEDAARLTLGHPMTFESLGEGLRSFKGRALCDLVRYRAVNDSCQPKKLLFEPGPPEANADLLASTDR